MAKKPGRRSRSELEMTGTVLVDVTRAMPPRPPAELTHDQSAVWRAAVGSMRGDWLSRGMHPVLIEYCRRVCRSHLIEQEIANTAAHDLERLDKLLGMAERESKAVLALARALRLTPQSQQHPKTAGRMARDRGPDYPLPWRYGRDQLEEEPS
jgi:hypothetical protein